MNKEKHSKRKKISKECYRFQNTDDFEFAPQDSRILNEMRETKYSGFYGTLHQFIYKNYSLVKEMPEKEEKPLDKLNDVLYAHSIFPDSGPEWDLLFSIRSLESTEYFCPICLFNPIAPRITKCGHIFCADCLRRLFECNQDDTTCPVCGKKIKPKSICRCEMISYDTFEIEEKEKIRFRKVQKNKHNTLVYDSETLNSLRDQKSMDGVQAMNEKQDENESTPKVINPKCESMKFIPYASSYSSKFNRFSIADKKYIFEVLQKEKEEILSQIAIYSDDEFKDDEKLKLLNIELHNNEEEHNKISSHYKSNEDNEPQFLLENPSEDLITYFYQEETGKPIFLDRISRNMLLEEYGSLENAPDELELNVIAKRKVNANESFFSHHRTFNHIPYGIDIYFVVCDLIGIVSPEVLNRHNLELSEISEEEIKNGPKHSKSISSFHSFDAPIVEPENPPPKWKNTEEDFPSLSSLSSTPSKQLSKPKANVQSPWGNISVQLKVPSQPSTTSETNKLPVRSSSWSQLH